MNLFLKPNFKKKKAKKIFGRLKNIRSESLILCGKNLALILLHLRYIGDNHNIINEVEEDQS